MTGSTVLATSAFAVRLTRSPDSGSVHQTPADGSRIMCHDVRAGRYGGLRARVLNLHCFSAALVYPAAFTQDRSVPNTERRYNREQFGAYARHPPRPV